MHHDALKNAARRRCGLATATRKTLNSKMILLLSQTAKCHVIARPNYWHFSCKLQQDSSNIQPNVAIRHCSTSFIVATSCYSTVRCGAVPLCLNNVVCLERLTMFFIAADLLLMWIFFTSFFRAVCFWWHSFALLLQPLAAAVGFQRQLHCHISVFSFLFWIYIIANKAKPNLAHMLSMESKWIANYLSTI